jgi:tetratricopeptide (TPR) repeat protein
MRGLMFLFFSLIFLSTLAQAAPSSSRAPPAPTTTTSSGDAEFKAKLTESIQKTEKSIKIIRKQIIESQNAPFLADLYVQLGDLLAQKAIALYYVKIENDSKVEAGPTKTEEAQPVVLATREAIEVYKTVLHDFPAYPKRPDVMYKLAVSYKSIDDVPQFIGAATKVIHDYPNTDYSMRASLLLGRHFLDSHDYDSAFPFLKPIADSNLTYEKNLARHWIGLIYLGQEKYADALHQFELVISDPDLKEQENPYDLKKASGRGKTDLKREALLDSIRAYTTVYEKNPDPVAYYSKLAPTETYFQEVMEKLAIRYVILKKYDQSVKLLRVTSERTSDPQKIINVYREVLLLMPLETRLAIPVEEMAFVLHQFDLWQSDFKVPAKTYSASYWFFEKQIRDVATRNHDLAKHETNLAKRKALLEHAKDYYRLYLPYFSNTPSTDKLAIDLADVYYLLGDYLDSGDLYLRIYQGEFGKSPNKKALIENAILALQKDKSEIFYEKVRSKGLLIKAVSTYQASSKALKNDPKLELLRLKTEYEQGFLPQAIDNLYAFAKTHRNNKEAEDAGDIIMDYFNTLNDFSGLKFWSDKLLALKLPDSAFNRKLVQIRTQSKSKIMQEKVKSIAGYDEFSQGKSYLAAALQSNDSELASAVIQEALSKSKREHDLATFLEAATLIAKKETNPQKRVGILKSVAQENLKVGNIYTSLEELRQASLDPALDPTARKSLNESIVNTSLLLHDLVTLQKSVVDPSFKNISSETIARVRDQISDALDSPIDVTGEQASVIFQTGLSEDALLALFKARNKLPSGLNSRVAIEVKAHCGSQSRQAVCLWSQLTELEAVRAKVVRALRTSPPDLKSLEGVAAQFMDASRQYQALEGGGDAHLETVVSIRGKELYLEFASYLNRVANANPTLRNDLIQKVKESEASAQIYQQKCQVISQKATSVNPAMKYCAAKTVPPLASLMYWDKEIATSSPRSDPNGDELENLKKSVFSSDADPEPMLRLAAYHLQKGNLYHAVAIAEYGTVIFKAREAEFKGILGCGLLKLGFLTEAAFHLKTASDYQNLRAGCVNRLQRMRSP